MSKNSHLNKTIEAYEKCFDQYLLITPNSVTGEYKILFDQVLANVAKTASIFEIGTGTGRDADYIDSLGYKVTRSDVANSFIDYNRAAGKEIIKLNAITDQIVGKYDLILAMAVFLHFNTQEFEIALKNVHQALNKDGLFLIGLKNGYGERLSSDKFEAQRYYKYWDQQSIQTKLEDFGFAILTNQLSHENKWIRIVCKKC
jgi:SAM-dependent methyltransferase